MKSTLEETLKYRNDAIVYRFIETWDLPFEEAMAIFREMLRWLWLSARLKEGADESAALAITQSMKVVDEMWHTFILFTQEYHAFCERYFGFYLHHVPTSKQEYEAHIDEHERDPEASIARRQAWFLAQCERIYDILGEETLIKWYSEYLDRYTDEFLRSIWRWSFSPYDTRVRNSIRLYPSGQPTAPREVERPTEPTQQAPDSRNVL